MSHRHIVLIACCGKKADTACKARDLYQSPLFRKSVAYAERRGLTWAILSAAHGLVMPDDVIAPYDVTLTKMTKAERAACRTTIDDQRKRLMGWARQEATSAACVIDAETDRSLTLLASACGSYFQAFNLISRALGA